MKINLKKGFTLIELLVVVAIIALLASITMGYLTSARKKGNDAGVKTNLATVRSVSEIFYLSNNNSYLPAGGVNPGGTCPTAYDANGINMFSQNKDVFGAIAEAVKRGDGTPACYNSANNWAVAVGLNLVPGSSWCVDNQGAAKVVNVDPSGAIDSGTNLCIN
jgi:prepilin-type N-terminal cleavage/methylation domain-containing protein